MIRCAMALLACLGLVAAGCAERGLVPGARLAIIEKGAHLTMQDEPERYVEVVRAFLREVDHAR